MKHSPSQATIRKSWKEENFIFLPEKAVYWEGEKALLIADLHLGKASHFRKNGIAIPSQVIEQNFETLSVLINKWQPQQVFFLGDLFHSAHNQEWEMLGEFLDSYPSISWELIKGNHDILPPKNYDHIPLVRHEFIEHPSGIVLSHEPREERMIQEGTLNICGHIHPAIRMRGKGRQSLRLPCYFMKRNQWILAAFGAFTGTYTLYPSEQERAYVIVDGQVVEVR